MICAKLMCDEPRVDGHDFCAGHRELAKRRLRIALEVLTRKLDVIDRSKPGATASRTIH